MHSEMYHKAHVIGGPMRSTGIRGATVAVNNEYRPD